MFKNGHTKDGVPTIQRGRIPSCKTEESEKQCGGPVRKHLVQDSNSLFSVVGVSWTQRIGRVAEVGGTDVRGFGIRPAPDRKTLAKRT